MSDKVLNDYTQKVYKTIASQTEWISDNEIYNRITIGTYAGVGTGLSLSVRLVQLLCSNLSVEGCIQRIRIIHQGQKVWINAPVNKPDRDNSFWFKRLDRLVSSTGKSSEEILSAALSLYEDSYNKFK